MPLKYNPFTGRYEYAEEDQEPTYNEFEGKYEVGRPEDTSYSPFTGRYSKKGKRLVDKLNPYTGRYPRTGRSGRTPSPGSTSSGLRTRDCPRRPCP